MAYLGTRYFCESARTLGEERAAEGPRRQYESMPVPERLDKGLFTPAHVKVDTSEVPAIVVQLDPVDIIRAVVKAQSLAAFKVAYQGAGTLPHFIPGKYSDRPPYSILWPIVCSGIVLAKHVAELPEEEYYKSANCVSGADEMVAFSLKHISASLALMQASTIGEQTAGYDVSREDAGYGLFRAHPGVGRYVLEAADAFWSVSSPDLEESEPQFTERDAIRLCDSDSGVTAMMNHAHLFPPMTPQLFLQILHNIPPSKWSTIFSSPGVCGFERVVEAFHLDSLDDQRTFTLELLRTGHSPFAYDYYNELVKQKIPAFEIFRRNIGEQSYEFTAAILEGKLTDEHRALGITEAGDRGLEQLRSVVMSIQSFIVAKDKTPKAIEAEIARIQSSEIYGKLWKIAVRFDVDSWGERSKEEILRILWGLWDVRSQPEHDVTAYNTEVYHPEVINVREPIQQVVRLGSDVLKQVEIYSALFKNALDEVGQNTRENSLECAVSAFSAELKAAILEIDNKLENSTIDRKKESLLVQKRRLDSALQSGYEQDLLRGSFIDAYDKLRNIKAAKSILRKKALQELAVGGKLDKALSLGGNTEKERVSALIEYIQNDIVYEGLLPQRANDATYKKYLTEILFNTTIMSAALARYFSASSTDATDARTVSIRMTPTRDIGLELSGQIADACWAKRSGDIAEGMPNCTAVLFSRIFGNDKEALVGAGLLLEATDTEGEDLLIVRGLNPIQNLINSVDPSDFLRLFIEYAGRTAERAGRRLAMVVDYASGAATNRPALFAAMQQYVATNKLQRVTVDPAQVTFNGYTLEGVIYSCAPS
jgi:hypothetical protein